NVMEREDHPLDSQLLQQLDTTSSCSHDCM
ncbi:hypothetical protein SLEP1_g55615, partial [Rubroshorea leprosula]